MINFYFSDLQKKGLVDFKFSPVVTISNDKKTVFNIVKNIPYLQQTTNVSSSIDTQSNSYNYKDVGTQIDITNVTITDDSVYFQLDLTYEIITDNSITPKTSKRTISNYVKLKTSESMLLSGLKTSELINNSIEIPFIANIPYLGELFKYRYNSSNNETFALYIENINDVDISLPPKGVSPL